MTRLGYMDLNLSNYNQNTLFKSFTKNQGFEFDKSIKCFFLKRKCGFHLRREIEIQQRENTRQPTNS